MQPKRKGERPRARKRSDSDLVTVGDLRAIMRKIGAESDRLDWSTDYGRTVGAALADVARAFQAVIDKRNRTIGEGGNG